jgi:phosphoglycerate dehydrogenase-like enzyme
MAKRTVFIADDFDLPETMEKVASQLRAQGIQVIRGPETIKGKKLEYPKERYQELFGEAEVAMFSSRSICSREVILAAPKLRGIVNPTIGVDTVDMKAANELGIIVGNGAIPENFLSMAEATVLLMLMLLYDPNRTADVLRYNKPKPVESQHWAKMMRGRTLGLIGLGRIARSVVRRLQGWEVNFIAYDPYVQQADAPEGVKMVDLDTLYRTSDIVSLFVVVTDETRGMINDHAFSLMKPTAYLVNTSRGQVVDEDALVRALEAKRIAGAALDTFNIEPLPADSPLRKFDNLFLTPHMIGHTQECFAVQPDTTCADATAFPDAAVENILNILNGVPPKYCVNPEVIPKWRERIAKLDAEKSK